MRKTGLWLITIIFTFLCLSGCSPKEKKNADIKGGLHIAAAVFPAYDWARNVLGTNPAGIELTLLADNGVDLHSWQPSVDDILTISKADLFIYTGGESDQWISDALKNADNPGMRVIKMLDVIGKSAKTEETVEGMQSEAEEEETFDEHLWLSLRCAEMIVSTLADEISALDPENEEYYRKNAAACNSALAGLDEQYSRAAEAAVYRTLLFGDRFPFRYLTDDYGLDYYAAFPGCSAETEASFETITFLAGKCNELGLPAVLTIEGSDKKIAETIVNNTETKNQAILTLDSMQSVTAEDIRNGTTYLSVMEANLDTLIQALGEEQH